MNFLLYYLKQLVLHVIQAAETPVLQLWTPSSNRPCRRKSGSWSDSRALGAGASSWFSAPPQLWLKGQKSPPRSGIASPPTKKVDLLDSIKVKLDPNAE
jgi:hypothetical protein